MPTKGLEMAGKNKIQPYNSKSKGIPIFCWSWLLLNAIDDIAVMTCPACNDQQLNAQIPR